MIVCQSLEARIVGKRLLLSVYIYIYIPNQHQGRLFIIHTNEGTSKFGPVQEYN